MKYKVIVHHDGSWNCDVLNHEKHQCSEIVNVIGSFGEIKAVKDKRDEVPVKDSIHIIGGANVY